MLCIDWNYIWLCNFWILPQQVRKVWWFIYSTYLSCFLHYIYFTTGTVMVTFSICCCLISNNRSKCYRKSAPVCPRLNQVRTRNLHFVYTGCITPYISYLVEFFIFTLTFRGLNNWTFGSMTLSWCIVSADVTETALLFPLFRICNNCGFLANIPCVWFIFVADNLKILFSGSRP